MQKEHPSVQIQNQSLQTPTRLDMGAALTACLASSSSASSSSAADRAPPSLRVNDVDRAVLELKRTRERMTSTIARVDVEIARDVADLALAREMRDVTSCKRALAGKRAREALRTKLAGFASACETSLREIDAAQATKSTLDALRCGNAALKEIQTACGDVEALAADAGRIKRWFEVLGEASPVTDEDVDQEYAALVAAEEESAVVELPDAPKGLSVALEEEVVEEHADLGAEAQKMKVVVAEPA